MANKLSYQGQGACIVGSVTVDPASLATTAQADTEVVVADAVVGDIVTVSPPAALDANIQVCGAFCSEAGKIKIRLRNNSGSTVDVASGSWSYTLVRA